jgi:AhpC/TSA family
MSLEEKLAAIRDGAAKRIPPERVAIMHRATNDLRNSGIMDRVIKPGAQAPDFTLNDQNGHPVTLSALAQRGAVVVSVFRGFW